MTGASENEEEEEEEEEVEAVAVGGSSAGVAFLRVLAFGSGRLRFGMAEAQECKK